MAKKKSKEHALEIEDIAEESISNDADSDALLSDDAPVEDIVDDTETDVSQAADTATSINTDGAVSSGKQSATSVLVAVLVGGVIAGAGGYILGKFQNNHIQPQLDANTAALRDLQSATNETPEPVDLTPLELQIEELAATSAQFQVDFEHSLSVLTDRIESIEKQPAADGTLQDVALAAYQRDIDALREQISGQQSELQAMMNATSAQLQATRDEANAIEAQALESAKFAQVRSAISKIQSSIESGAPISVALNEYEAASGEAPPQELLNVAEGTPTLSALIVDFPEVARDALKIARDEGISGEPTGSISSFLRDQFSIRSTTPQEGDGVDAVLSRVEASLVRGRLNEALNEVSELPEVVRSTMGDWVSQAERRALAVDAAATLFSKYNSN